ncbi:hypothetical protein HHI36_023197, partial [Cryptolaemus montrouzieri]
IIGQNEGVNLEDLEERVPNITKSEVKHAIKVHKNGKATGPDEIHAETTKNRPLANKE